MLRIPEVDVRIIPRIAVFDTIGCEFISLTDGVNKLRIVQRDKRKQLSDIVRLWELDLTPDQDCLEVLLDRLLGMKSRTVDEGIASRHKVLTGIEVLPGLL